MVLRPILRPIQRKILRLLIAAAQRIFITADPVLETNFTFQNTKTFPDDFDLSIDAILPTAATTVTLFGQTASADHYIKVLSTGFASINIDTSVVTSTVLATKDNKQRRYGVKLVGNDFIFTEDGATIDTVTDAVAAAKTLIINALCQSNGADFFNRTASDPRLTDLTTASNSVSWLLNLATGNTEPAIGGGNDLTYNNAPDSTRELFTFNQSVTPNRWERPSVIINGDFSDGFTGWVILNSGQTVEIINGRFHIVSDGGVAGVTQTTLTEGANYIATVDITVISGTCNIQLGTEASLVSASISFEQIYNDVDTTSAFLIRATACEAFFDNYAVKRIIEVA